MVKKNKKTVEEIKADKRKWYYDNYERERARQLNRKKQIKKWYQEYKSTLKCKYCDESHPACIDFHHVGKKDRNICKLVEKGYSKENLIKEIALCEPVCSNCHRKIHAQERTGIPFSFPVKTLEQHHPHTT